MHEDIYLVGWSVETINGEYIVTGTFASTLGYEYDIIIGRNRNSRMALGQAVQSYMAIKAGQPIGSF